MRAQSAAPGARDPGTAASSVALDADSNECGLAIITQPDVPVTVVADMTAGAKQIADEINEQHHLARDKFAEHAIECGRLLLAQKQRVGYGNFVKWIEANCEFSVATANNYMKVAKNPSALGKSGAIRRLYPSGFADAPKKISVEKNDTKSEPPPEFRIVEGDSPLMTGAPSMRRSEDGDDPVIMIGKGRSRREQNASTPLLWLGFSLDKAQGDLEKAFKRYEKLAKEHPEVARFRGREDLEEFTSKLLDLERLCARMRRAVNGSKA